MNIIEFREKFGRVLIDILRWSDPVSHDVILVSSDYGHTLSILLDGKWSIQASAWSWDGSFDEAKLRGWLASDAGEVFFLSDPTRPDGWRASGPGDEREA